MASYTSMYVRSKKGIKMKMETTIGLYGKGNEINFWCLFCLGSWLILSGNCCYMHYRHQSTLYQICTNLISNDNVYQGLKIVFGDDNIHSSLCMAREKLGNLYLYVNSTPQCDNCNDISKCIMVKVHHCVIGLQKKSLFLCMKNNL
jgi:hypothetical protein